MKEIGGYHQLELPKGIEFHNDSIRLNNGRNAFAYILNAKKPKKVYLPIYSCDSLIQTLLKYNIKYEFYELDARLEISQELVPKLDEKILYINYFGVKKPFIEHLLNKYHLSSLIIDSSQGFFLKPSVSVDSFYSARKFFGVPDGGYLYTSQFISEPLAQSCSYQSCTHLLGRIDIGAKNFYQDYLDNERRHANLPLGKMSNLTRALLRAVDYDAAQKSRNDNFSYLHEHLYKRNLLSPAISQEVEGPMVYPFLFDRSDLKQKLIEKKIYVATYWKEVLSRASSVGFEFFTTRHLCPLPVDQRYGIEEMRYILNVLNCYI